MSSQRRRAFPRRLMPPRQWSSGPSNASVSSQTPLAPADSRRQTPMSAVGPGCAKTRDVTTIAQLQNHRHGGFASVMRKTDVKRINLAFCQPEKAFPHSLDPEPTFRRDRVAAFRCAEYQRFRNTPLGMASTYIPVSCICSLSCRWQNRRRYSVWGTNKLSIPRVLNM